MNVADLRAKIIEMAEYCAEEMQQFHRAGSNWEKWNGKLSAYQQVVALIDGNRAAACAKAFEPFREFADMSEAMKGCVQRAALAPFTDEKLGATNAN